MNRRGRQVEVADERCMVVLLPTVTSGGAGWKAIAFRHSGSGASEQFSVLGERALSSPGEDLTAWAGAWKPAKALAILPASATLCRTCALPPTQGDQLLSALRLQAETALMGGVPPHRLGMVPLPEVPGANDTRADGGRPNSGRQGIILAWPESSIAPALPTLPDYTEVRFAPTFACLLALLRGLPPAQPLVRADRSDGTILFMLASTGSAGHGFVLRSTREDPSDDLTWREGILRAAAETILAADGSTEEIKELHGELTSHLDDGSFLALPPAARELVLRRLPGSSDIDAERALALGALLAATGPLAPLVSLRASLPRPKPHPLEQALRRLQSPQTAATVIVASLAVFLLAPIAFAGARNLILRWKLSDVESYERENRITRQKAALYTTLAKSTWPMTKLLGDLANSMPESIDVESIQVNAGQSITLRGVARSLDKKEIGKDGAVTTTHLSPQAVVLAFESAARDTGIFSEFQYQIEATDGREQSVFTIIFTAGNPTHVHAWKDADDYSLHDLRDRRYPNWRTIERTGERTGEKTGTAAASATPPTPVDDTARAAATAKPTTPRSETPDAARGRELRGADAVTPPVDETATAVEPAAEGETAAAGEETAVPAPVASDRGVNRRRPPTPEGGAAGPTPSTGTPQPSSGPKVEIPAPMSDDEIKALTKAQATDFLSKIAKARQQPDLDQETKDRLKKDFDRVLARLKSAS